jgi:hypothetical protein
MLIRSIDGDIKIQDVHMEGDTKINDSPRMEVDTKIDDFPYGG